MKIAYIGELPPPYGGVTIKNKLVFNKVYQPYGAQFINLMECKHSKKSIPKIMAKIIFSMLRKEYIVIGVGTPSRRKALLTLQYLLGGKKGLRRVTVIGMGGQIPDHDKRDRFIRYLMKNINKVWLESHTMVKEMFDIGIENAAYFPNCRTVSASVAPKTAIGDTLKLVFFSKVAPLKGMDTIMDAFQNIEGGITLDIYGEVEQSFEAVFFDFVEKYDNVFYHGVFDSTKENVFVTLNQYDIELLPSRWPGEGMPGALIEAKMAGISSIVSNWRFNSEIVQDGIDGVVLSVNSAEELAKEINRLYKDKTYVRKLKQASYESRMDYCIETYIDKLMNL